MVCAAFDTATDEAIYAVRDRVRMAGIALPDRPPHRPHFSLAAARVQRGAELDRVLTVAGEVAAEHQPMPVLLAEVGRFGRAGVLWLGPLANAALAALQRDTYRALHDAGWPAAFGERSSPQSWIPHCTLATRVPKPALRELQGVISQDYQPIHGTIDALATILVGGRGDVALHPLKRDD